jgi:hypothetical protein
MLVSCCGQGFSDGLNLNCACVRSTKNVRGDFKVRRQIGQMISCPSFCSLCFLFRLASYFIFSALFTNRHTPNFSESKGPKVCHLFPQ